MRALLILPAVALFASAQPAVSTAQDLGDLVLACDGAGVWTETVTDDNGTIGKFSDDTDTKHKRSASGRVTVRFTGEFAELRFPITFPASVRRGGQQLGPVAVSDDEIAYETRDMFGRSRGLKINRRTGEIELRHRALTFSGTCNKVEAAPEERKF